MKHVKSKLVVLLLLQAYVRKHNSWLSLELKASDALPQADALVAFTM